MADLKKATQGSDGLQTGRTPDGTKGEHNKGAEFGTSERATRGTNRDADETGESKNQGHGHPESDSAANG